MQKALGNCHCGAIRFKIQSSFEELTTCDCSLCEMRNAVMLKIAEADLQLIEGEKHLTEYQWNMQIAKHYFCKICGIYLFHNKRAAPDYLGINIHCLQDISISNIKIRQTDGKDMSVKSKNAQSHWPGPRI